MRDRPSLFRCPSGNESDRLTQRREKRDTESARKLSICVHRSFTDGTGVIFDDKMCHLKCNLQTILTHISRYGLLFKSMGSKSIGEKRHKRRLYQPTDLA